MSKTLNRLSTGLRINSAADDASGMAIADSLKSQSMGLGQAIRNANDGISIVQTADGALEEAINITNTIKTKSIQAAQDGQTLSSRNKIQADIDKLLQEVDILANTTSFNGKKLLSGEFTNNKFQVGATSGETVDISIGAANTGKVGHINTAKLTVESEGRMALEVRSNVSNQDMTLQSVDLQYNNSKENGLGALAEVINKSSEAIGITAQAVVESSSNGEIKAGTIAGGENGFKINGVRIGEVTVTQGDSEGTLKNAINQRSAETGVTASMKQGQLVLSSADGRAIKVEGDVIGVMGKSAEGMSTFGEIRLTQTGANGFEVTTDGAGTALGAKVVTTGTTTANEDMVLAAGSSLAATSTLAAGTKIGGTMANVNAGAYTQDAVISAGSTIGNDSTFAKGTVMTSDTNVDNGAANQLLTGSATVKAGSIIASGTTLAKGTVLTTAITTSSGTISAGTTLSQDTAISADLVLDKDMTLIKGSTIDSTGMTLTAGSVFESDTLTLNGAKVLSNDMTLTKGTDLAVSTFAAGSVMGVDIASASAITTTEDMVLKAGSAMLSGSTIGKGSTLGGDVTLASAATLAEATTLTAGSTLATATTISKGTLLTNDVSTAGGVVTAGTTLEQDITTNAALTLSNDMTLNSGSKIAAASKIVSSGGGDIGGANLSEEKSYRMSDIDVTSQEGAQIAIAISDAALASYDKIRSDLGSVQNQLSSTISNISVTRTNVQAAESNIRDVDFAEESANFSKLQILSQTGSYALSQANASSQTVTSLLQ
jgi:flagellin